jgi:hypothetical protein
MLPVPDFRGVAFVMWAVASFPLVLGALITFLAGCTGVEVTPRLGKLRYLVAASISAAAGWLVLAGTLGLSVWLFGLWETVIPGGPEILAVLIIIGVSSVLGATSAYQTGKMVSARLETGRVGQEGPTARFRGIRTRHRV